MNYREEEKTGKTKRILEGVALAFMFAIIAVVAVRYFMYSEKSFASELIWSDAAKEKYGKLGNDFVIYEVENAAVSKGMDNTLAGNEISDLTNYTVSNIVWFEPTNELQFTVKYPERELANSDVKVPYDYVTVDGNGKRYTDKTVETKTITGYVYCRVTFKNIDLFGQNRLDVLFEKDGNTLDSRNLYFCYDEISDDINVYSVAYSDGKHLFSFRTRMTCDLPVEVYGNGALIKPKTVKTSKNGLRYGVFAELSQIYLEKYDTISVKIGDTEIDVYRSDRDRTLLEDYSTEEYPCYAYFLRDERDLNVTPVRTLKYGKPD